ncbi:MAG TPA: hypothetical protein ENK18_12045 [Deltaproteobacteria bacterium]|nr:hypothetical protein [Deltaproteobacteria bacterium]
MTHPAGASTTPAEPPLPLAELDRALRPVRRVIRYAMMPGARARFVERNTARHLDGALALDLPRALREDLASVAAGLAGFDAAPEVEQRTRLSEVYAGLARVDAVAGLPLPMRRLKPISKPIQRDVPEPPEPSAPAASTAPAKDPPPAGDDAPPRPPDDALSPPDEPGGDKAPEPVQIRPSTPLSELDPALGEALAQHGLTTVADLLGLRPAAWETLEIHGAGRPPPQRRVALGGRLSGGWWVLSPSGERRRRSRLVGAAAVQIQWASEAVAPWLELDRKVVIVGDVLSDGLVAEAEIVVGEGSVVHLPRYELQEIEDRALRALVTVCSERLGPVRDPVSSELLKRLSLPPRGDALIGVHRRDPQARCRLAFDEALLVQLAGALPRARGPRKRGLPHHVVHGFAGHISQTLGLILDDDQQRCFEDVKRELRRAVPMRRVITGEVGAGKGAVALMATATVVEGRAQVLVLADDDAGAATRFLHSEQVLREGGMICRLVQSPPTGSQRDAIRRGEVHVVFGSLELLEHELAFRRLGLVVAIERERWGHASQLHAQLPAPLPDLLVLTSVPVGPRLLMTAYADHDVSVLTDRLRRPASITLCHADQRAEAYAKLRRVVEQGHQAIVVFPMVRGKDPLDAREALRMVRALEADALAGMSVGLFHGSMPADERQRVYEDFSHRRLQVLVCTTRIEEGPKPPGVAVLVVEQAESVDAWRLHRLIGFLSRSAVPSEAILVSGDLASEEAKARLLQLQEAPSGTALTEALVAQRGVEQVVADGVPPLPQLTWLDLDQDLSLVLSARDEAARLLGADPGLRRGAHAEIARELFERWEELWPEAPRSWAPPRLEEPGEPGRKRRRRRRRRR